MMPRAVAAVLALCCVAAALRAPPPESLRATAGRRRALAVITATIRGGETDLVAPRTNKKKRSKELLDGGVAKERTGLADLVRTLWKKVVGDVVSTTAAKASKPSDKAAAVKNKNNNNNNNRKAPTSVAGRQAARIARELADFSKNPPEGCKVAVGKKLSVWVVTLTGAPGTIFDGEKYKLRVSFPADYPAKPPSVYFLAPTPRHPHVYTNGDICLNLLGKDWRPSLTIAQLSLSILSMLSSAKQKGIPIDNANHADATPGQFQEGWMYHDDSC